VAFTLFVLFETWLGAGRGLVRDNTGPRLVVLIAAILCAIGWVINAEGPAQWLLSRHDVAGIGPAGLWHLRRQRAEWFPTAGLLRITAAGFGRAPR